MVKNHIINKLIDKFGFTEDCFSNYYSDLFVNPKKIPINEVIEFLKKEVPYQSIEILYGDVKGHSWYKSRFISMPFAYMDVYCNLKIK